MNKKIGKLAAVGALVGMIATASIGVAVQSAMAQTPTPQTPVTQQSGGRQRGGAAPSQSQSGAPAQSGDNAQAGGADFGGRGGRGGPEGRGGGPGGMDLKGGESVTVTGTIAQYVVDSNNVSVGFDLADKTQVRLPPGDVTEVQKLFPINTQVTLVGHSMTKSDGSKVLLPRTISAGSNTYTVSKPDKRGEMPPPDANGSAPAAHEVVTVTATIASLDLSDSGNLMGITLSDKTVVHLPRVDATTAAKFKVGASVEVVGDKHTESDGTVDLRAHSIKLNGETVFTAPAGGKGGPHGGRGPGGKAPQPTNSATPTTP